MDDHSIVCECPRGALGVESRVAAATVSAQHTHPARHTATLGRCGPGRTGAQLPTNRLSVSGLPSGARCTPARPALRRRPAQRRPWRWARRRLATRSSCTSPAARTLRCAKRSRPIFASSRASATAEPTPPSGWWSSATTIRPPVASAAATSVSMSIGLTEYRSITVARIPVQREPIGCEQADRDDDQQVCVVPSGHGETGVAPITLSSSRSPPDSRLPTRPPAAEGWPAAAAAGHVWPGLKNGSARAVGRRVRTEAASVLRGRACVAFGLSRFVGADRDGRGDR